jgi:hypothetical protein
MSFYSTYHEHPVGRYHLQVCRTLSCALAGADELYDFLAEETGLVSGETDAEGLFSLQNVECLGSCGTAPVLQVNDTYHERVGALALPPPAERAAGRSRARADPRARRRQRRGREGHPRPRRDRRSPRLADADGGAA